MKFTYAADARPVDGFTIRRGIHRGGFGEVYYAVSDAGKEVALKLLTHDLDTELRGIRQCLNLKHANLVTIFDVKTDADGDHWVVMEYVNGSNLEEVLTAFPQGLPIREVQDWMEGLVSGVEYLHDRGLIHRDLKPANVYRENGVVKIGDVGLSKRIDGDRRHQHTERIGTVYYMAPEVTHGQYGPAVDIYSLGVILYELLTGKLPFNGETSGEILMKQLSAAPDLAVIPSNLRPVLAHALEKDPQKRTPSARQLGHEFEQAVGASGASSPRHVSCETARKDTDRNGDTGRRPQKKDEQPGSLAYEAGRIYGELTTPIRRAGHKHNPARPPREKTPRTMEGILLLAVLALLLFLLPRRPLNWSDIVLGTLVLAVPAGLMWRAAHRRVATRVAAIPPPSRLQSFSDWTGSFAVASVAAVLFTNIPILVVTSFSQPPGAAPPPWSVLCYATAVTLIGTWSLIGVRGMTYAVPVLSEFPRWLHVAAGVVTGIVASTLQSYLLVASHGSPLRAERQSSAFFHHIGSHSLMEGPFPTDLGFAVFFGGLFALLGKRFLKSQNPQRKRHWTVGNVVVAAIVAWLWVHLFAFRVETALLWSAAIAASVQIAAPWQPRISMACRK